VLVLEDLHWADDALLDFLQELVDPIGHPAAVRPSRKRRQAEGGL
jgi:predicted ATPase